MALDYCPDCSSTLQVTSDRLNNNDEITLLCCLKCGCYCVYSPSSDSVTLESDHSCEQALEDYQHKRTNGDRIMFKFCPECHFYAADELLSERT